MLRVRAFQKLNRIKVLVAVYLSSQATQIKIQLISPNFWRPSKGILPCCLSFNFLRAEKYKK